MPRLSPAALLTLAMLLATPAALAGALRDRLMERRTAQQSEGVAEESATGTTRTDAQDVRVVRDIAYGSDARQRFDVYAPRQAASGAPLILMVQAARGRRATRATPRSLKTRWRAG